MSTEAQRLAASNYYYKNKARIAKKKKEYNRKNRDKINAQARAKTEALRVLKQWNAEHGEDTKYSDWKRLTA